MSKWSVTGHIETFLNLDDIELLMEAITYECAEREDLRQAYKDKLVALRRRLLALTYEE
jgi:hypothetical protein